MTSSSSSHTDTAGSALALAAHGAQVADLAILHVPSDTAKREPRAPNRTQLSEVMVKSAAPRHPRDSEPMEITDQHTGRAMPVHRTSFFRGVG
jgi:hypothetical protein